MSFSPFVGEIVGTMILIIMGCGVNAAGTLTSSMGKGTGWLLGTIGWGMAVAFGVFAVGEISGAHLNPAVTLGLAIAGDFAWESVGSYMLAQMIGAMLGATVVYLHYLPHWAKTADPATKLGVFSTAPAIDQPSANVLSEFIGTFMLVFGILTIGANEFTDGLWPLVVGLLVMAIGNSLGSTTGYAINPARDLGPRIMHAILPIAGKGGSNWGYSWVPVVGPLLGGLYGGLFYVAVFRMETSVPFWMGSLGFLALAVLVVLRQRDVAGGRE